MYGTAVHLSNLRSGGYSPKRVGGGLFDEGTADREYWLYMSYRYTHTHTHTSPSTNSTSTRNTTEVMQLPRFFTGADQGFRGNVGCADSCGVLWADCCLVEDFGWPDNPGGDCGFRVLQKNTPKLLQHRFFLAWFCTSNANANMCLYSIRFCTHSATQVLSTQKVGNWY